MKKRLNIFCVCMIAAFLLSVSGNVYLIIEMFVNGVEVGMKAAQGEITEIPQYKMVHVLPTDMMETTGTVTNLKDGRQLAVKPITALVECPYSHSSHGFEVLQGLIGFIVIIGFVYATVYFAKLMIHALGATHLYILFHQRIPTLDLRPCVSRGVAPISTYCPYRARYLLNPVHGGTQGVVHSVHYTLG